MASACAQKMIPVDGCPPELVPVLVPIFSLIYQRKIRAEAVDTFLTALKQRRVDYELLRLIGHDLSKQDMGVRDALDTVCRHVRSAMSQVSGK